MKDEIFDYLKSFGFTSDDIRAFEKNNTEMFYVTLKEVRENIEFLLDKGLTQNEIISIINYNPFMLTDEKNRREYYDNIYLNVLKLDKDELITLIKSNNDAYIASPIELENIINYLSNFYDITTIKKLIISNPRIITSKLDEVKRLVKLV